MRAGFQGMLELLFWSRNAGAIRKAMERPQMTKSRISKILAFIIPIKMYNYENYCSLIAESFGDGLIFSFVHVSPPFLITPRAACGDATGPVGVVRHLFAHGW